MLETSLAQRLAARFSDPLRDDDETAKQDNFEEASARAQIHNCGIRRGRLAHVKTGAGSEIISI